MSTPTPEQAHAVDVASAGADMVVEALAGTGKTTTLVSMARSRPRTTGLYLAFNRAIVDEASAKFPSVVTCRTAHALAIRSVGDPYRRRLNGPRMKSGTIAKILDIEGFRVATPSGSRWISAGFLAGLLMRSLRSFCLSADAAPNRYHVPIPRLAREDPDLFAAYGQMRDALAPKLGPAWADITNPDGRLPFDLNCVLKLYQLRCLAGDAARLPYDVIMFDEAQDANAVMRSIVELQTHAQRVWVGDTFQQINGWNGAINALAEVTVPSDRRVHLTRSFRFGPEIAEAANVVLSALGAPFPIVGSGRAGVVAPIENPEIVLSRTNAAAVGAALDLLEEGRRPHIVGGAADIVSFCEGALALMEGGSTWHPELVCFDSWGDVLAYAANDELGGDLAFTVRLIVDHGAQLIIDVLRNQPKEADADRILSTAHKSKGREWGSVALAGDYPTNPTVEDPEELRLLYVAATRAQAALDVGRVPLIAEALQPTPTKEITA